MSVSAKNALSTICFRVSGGATLLENRVAISGFSWLTAIAHASEQGRRTIRLMVSRSSLEPRFCSEYSFGPSSGSGRYQRERVITPPREPAT
jgi:hypothetical protein